MTLSVIGQGGGTGVTRLPLRVAFMGTSDFAVPTLITLIAHHQVVCVYTRLSRLAGRRMRARRSPVHEVATAAGLPVRVPQTWEEPIVQQEWEHLGADVGVVTAYGLILPEPVLAVPQFGCVNVHASLLPRWRGAAPIHRAVMAGDRVSGVTTIRMDASLDTGPILLTAAVPMTDSTTTGSLYDTLAHVGAQLLLQTLAGLAAGTLVPRSQLIEGITYARKISESESHINWTLSAVTLSALIRGLSPWPGALCNHNSTGLKVLMAEVVEKDVPTETVPGTVLDDCLTVACGVGMLRLMRVQRPGKTVLPAASFLRGYPLGPGTVLS